MHQVKAGRLHKSLSHIGGVWNPSLRLKVERLVRGCNPKRGRSVVWYEVPPVGSSSRQFRCRGSLLLEAEELAPPRAALCGLLLLREGCTLSGSSEELTGASRASEGASNAFNPSVIESRIASLRCNSPRRNSISVAIRSISCDWSSARS